MFTIRCNTCAAKLKVSQPSALHQKLACPKCGTMVLVEPPADWEPPAEWVDFLKRKAEAAAAQSQALSQSLSSSVDVSKGSPELTDKGPTGFADFDDIEKLLDKPVGKPQPARPAAAASQPSSAPVIKTGPGKSPVGKPPAGKPGGVAAKSAGQDPRKGSSASSPVPVTALSASAQQRQRWLIIGFSVAMGLVLVLAVIWMAMNKGRSVPVVKNDGQQQAKDNSANSGSADETDSEKPQTATQSTVTEPKSDPKSDPASDPNSELKSESETAVNPDLTGTANPTGDPPPVLPVSPLGTDTQPPTLDPMTPTNPATGVQNVQKTPDLGNALGNGARPTDDLSVAPQLLSPRSVNDALGDLSALIAQTSGTSLTELADAAATQTRVVRAGLSPLFVAKPDPVQVTGTLQERLAIPLKEVQYLQSPLAVEVNQLARLLGYPITFDLLHIDTAAIDLFQPMSWNASDVTIEQVLDRMLADAGLVKSLVTSGDAQQGVVATGLVIRPQGYDKFAEQAWEIPAMSERTAEQRAELERQAKLFLVPYAWDTAGSAGTIVSQGNGWQVSQMPVGHRVMAQWIANMQVAAEQIRSEKVEANVPVLPTRSHLARERLEHALQWPPSWGRGLDEVLEQLRRETGLRVLVDWDALSPLGWTAAVKVPGNVSSRTAREFLDQLTQAMELGWRIVDQQTVEITTHERLRARTDLEMYSLADLARTGLTAERIRDLLNAVIGVQAGRAGAIWYYDAATQSLWILAPQWLHQQVEPILERLRNKPAS